MLLNSKSDHDFRSNLLVITQRGKLSFWHKLTIFWCDSEKIVTYLEKLSFQTSKVCWFKFFRWHQHQIFTNGQNGDYLSWLSWTPNFISNSHTIKLDQNWFWIIFWRHSELNLAQILGRTDNNSTSIWQ